MLFHPSIFYEYYSVVSIIDDKIILCVFVHFVLNKIFISSLFRSIRSTHFLASYAFPRTECLELQGTHLNELNHKTFDLIENNIFIPPGVPGSPAFCKTPFHIARCTKSPKNGELNDVPLNLRQFW